MIYAIFLCSLLSTWCTAAPGGVIYVSAAECRTDLREWAQLNQYRGDPQDPLLARQKRLGSMYGENKLGTIAMSTFLREIGKLLGHRGVTATRKMSLLTKEQVLLGKEIIAGGFRCKIVKICPATGRVDLAFSVVDPDGNELRTFTECSSREGDTLTFLKLHQLFTIEIS